MVLLLLKLLINKIIKHNKIMGRPNRGTGSAGPKNPNNGGNKDQYSLGGTKQTNTSTKKSTRK